MPIYEYLCDCGKQIEKVFLTFSEAEKHENSFPCPKCGRNAGRQLELPFPAHLYGSPEGWEKPSPTAKRIVNPESISFESDKQGSYVKTG